MKAENLRDLLVVSRQAFSRFTGENGHRVAVRTVTALDRIADDIERKLDDWATGVYMKLFDSPRETQTQYLAGLVREARSADELVGVSLALLRHTDGFTRGEWFPEYVGLVVGAAEIHEDSLGQKFFGSLWRAVTDEKQTPWLPGDVRHDIIGTLTPYVRIEETFQGSRITYSQAGAAVPSGQGERR